VSIVHDGLIKKEQYSDGVKLFDGATHIFAQLTKILSAACTRTGGTQLELVAAASNAAILQLAGDVICMSEGQEECIILYSI